MTWINKSENETQVALGSWIKITVSFKLRNGIQIKDDYGISVLLRVINFKQDL